MNSSELTTGARIVWVQILVTRRVSRRASQRMPWKPVMDAAGDGLALARLADQPGRHQATAASCMAFTYTPESVSAP